MVKAVEFADVCFGKGRELALREVELLCYLKRLIERLPQFFGDEPERDEQRQTDNEEYKNELNLSSDSSSENSAS